IDSLKKAFDINPRTSFIAIQLAAIYQKKGKLNEAKDVFENALNANRNDKDLHYRYSKFLLQLPQSNADLIEYHLQRAFAPGDKNYDAQLLYGRQLYIKGSRDDSKPVFSRLKMARVAPNVREALLYPLEGFFHGIISKIEGSYGYINKDKSNEWIYFHRKNIPDEVWNILVFGTRVKYKVGFNFHGPSAFEIITEL
ncbi:MAG TPA: hypothetical protein VF607_08335, partial [Verrucomicrobiae bacterium]